MSQLISIRSTNLQDRPDQLKDRINNRSPIPYDCLVLGQLFANPHYYILSCCSNRGMRLEGANWMYTLLRPGADRCELENRF